jgi:hypothetical protein
MSVPTPPPLLDNESATFIQGGVSIVASSCDARQIPSIGRIAGCRVAPDRRRVTVCLAASQAPQLLADVRACGRIAVVFSRPTTHRSFQLKSDDAIARAPSAAELAVVASQMEAFAAEIALLGLSREQARVLLGCADEDLVAIDFTPNAAFEQTPGPGAGKQIALGDEAIR